mmetsp:Transcript_31455/g.61341  ORF Transcript_31455/g.61341 Transcript_31455/m.61341 type:complete len:425 (+) Transcript_31455:28-1302(+)|eukprot:CAMPEP_0175155392 /NCGR_PEP_ID=MMETSP0087-20121206/20950_1 /TAXON_ID=136419 /ORGANISM="Unknown Unknown, Strain D1" /LENGTH=424 /DNA_ID=CAMNT_0016442543 /DNA_START=25 /DNA_END=1299 /DNA_ORIENTATION=+
MNTLFRPSSLFRVASRRGFSFPLANFSSRAESFYKHINSELEGIREAGTFKNERIITSPQEASITVANSDKPVLNFCANNYLGLSNNQTLVAKAKDALDSHGLGLSSVRFICGTQDLHKNLEHAISEFHGMEDTIVWPSCFDANAGLFEVLFSKEDAVISDALNHASIIDGIRLCKAQRYRYQHMDMAHLEECLQQSQAQRHRIIVTDGVFSMDGHIAPLKEICDLADKYDALVFIDECHATGFFGKTGRGTDEYCGVQGRVDIINSTLGKALGGATGGYTTASKKIIDLLRQRGRPYLFSNALAPAMAAASIEVFRMLSASTELRDKLEANTQRFREGMVANGFDLGDSKDHPIVPVMLGDARLAADFAEEMLKEGIYVIGFSYPVVPKGAARIRTQISSAHSFDDIDHAIASFAKVKARLGC